MKKYGLLVVIFVVVLIVLVIAYFRLFVKDDNTPKVSIDVPRVEILEPILTDTQLLLRAQQGDVQAQYELGQAYLQGEGEFEQDTDKALEWLEQAASQGHARANYLMGVFYDQGVGVAQDDYLAVQWYRQGAHLGDADAQYQLGLSYDAGRGVEQDFIQAYVWLDMALRQVADYPDAPHALELVTKMLSPSEYQQAQDLAALCFESNYQTCQLNEN